MVQYGGKKINKCPANIPQHVAQAVEIIETGNYEKSPTSSTFPMSTDCHGRKSQEPTNDPCFLSNLTSSLTGGRHEDEGGLYEMKKNSSKANSTCRTKKTWEKKICADLRNKNVN